MCQNGGPDKICDICWSKSPANNSFMSVGIKHVKYWTPFDENKKVKNGIFGKFNKTNLQCVTAD